MTRWYTILSAMVASAGLLGAVAWAVTPAEAPQIHDVDSSSSQIDLRNLDDALDEILRGRAIFRFDTFGDEASGATRYGCTKPSRVRPMGVSDPA